MVEGWPPKVAWVQRGNCSTAAIAELLVQRVEELRAFDDDPVASFLVLE